MSKEVSTYQIIFENESILLINKPSETHSTLGKVADSTITQFLKIHYPNNFSINKEGGTLQRLDFETSGCLLIAKTLVAFEFFKDQISQHLITKDYFFLTTQKLPKTMAVKNYLYSRYRGSRKMQISDQLIPRSLYAETTFAPEKSFPQQGIYLVKATTNYGRRHQVRVHASSIGIPLIGDHLYGSSTDFQQLGITTFPQFILHAVSLKLPLNPFCDQQTFQAPLPTYLAEFINNY